MEKYKNKFWDEKQDAEITVLTPTYNRRETLLRTIMSIEKQTFSDWEYIIVDDGSTDDTSEVVDCFMQTTDHPVLYIKKENGGVHTARNVGINNARGELLLNLDSDDELVPEALAVFRAAWEKIPDDKKGKYREIVAQCMDERGKRVGKPFEENINQLSWDKARKACYKTGGEHVGCLVTDVMKHNLFPEPEGVTFVTENILWRKLDRQYCSYYINDMLRVYHLEGNNHLSSSGKMRLQNCRNALWESSQFLNDWATYKDGLSYMRVMVRYCVMNHILRHTKNEKEGIWTECALKGIKNRILFYLLFVPSMPLAVIYRRAKCSAEIVK